MMYFNVTIAYAIELPEDEWDYYTQYSGDGLDIIGEGEIGERIFLGKIFHFINPDQLTTGDLRLNVKPEIRDALEGIAEKYGLNKPQMMYIGGIS